MHEPITVISIDPGRSKCGLAIVSGPNDLVVHEQAVVETSALTMQIASTLRKYPHITHIVVGDGTGSAPLRKAIAQEYPHITVVTVNEHGSSERARARFLVTNPAPGWRRLIPPALQSPWRPYDDYVAAMLAEEFFASVEADFEE